MSQTMIKVDELTKDYGVHRAVDHISFEVHAGEVLGFLGPNGAGKTTTMKILTCFMAPTTGSAQVAGFDVTDQSLEVRQRIGYLPEDTPLYKDMLVHEYLDFVAKLRNLPKDARGGKIRDIAGLCGIRSHLGRPIGELSKGYRQRVGLAQAMIHDPPILVLDEPTSGLDPNQIVEIRSLIKEIGSAKFNESVEVHVRTGLNVRHAALWREKAGLWHDVASAGPVARYVQGRGREWFAAMTGSYDK